MASPYQQQALQRKLIYLGAVVVLFTASWMWRRYVVEEQAMELALREESRGEVDLGASSLRVAVSGLRGVATCWLWAQAIDKQKKNQWNEMELHVRTLTKLQPHFVTPWLFQSWNIAYNVSVESDRVSDKYFYVTRGIQLLAEGERRNRNNPDMRRELGFFTQMKICKSDENNTMKSLFQLSCIPPVDRNPEAFGYRADSVDWHLNINWEAFESFCKAHPQLVRRLHSPPLPYDPRREHKKFSCPTARHVILFLADNANVPSLYVQREESEKDWEQRKPRPDELERFPVLPTGRLNPYDSEEFTQESLVAKPVPDSFDAYMVARAWYGYAQEPLPPPSDIPGDSQPIRDRKREKMNKYMSTIIFRSSPSQAHSFVAERLEDEGWYDDKPFVITGWFKPSGQEDRPVEVGEKRDWSAEAWRRAYDSWRRYGIGNHLDFEIEAEREEKERLAGEAMEALRKKGIQVQPGEFLPRLKPEQIDDELRKRLQAYEFMQAFNSARQLTNYHHFVTVAAVAKEPKTILARKHLYEAEQLRLGQGMPLDAMRVYEAPEALQAWREVLEENAEYRKDMQIQEYTVEAEIKYLRLYRSLHGVNLTRDLAMQSYLSQGLASPPLGADWTLLSPFGRTQLLPELDVKSPFDRDSKGEPLIPEGVRDSVLIRRDLKKQAPEPQPPAGGEAVPTPPQPPR